MQIQLGGGGHSKVKGLGQRQKVSTSDTTKVHVLKDSKDQEGKWKENWVSTNKMLKAVPCDLDYIRQRLANSRRVSED